MVEEKKIAARESARPITVDKFDANADIVVVGSGAGGLTAALFGRWLGNDVVLLEKAPELGGTSRKSAFWFWIPNNEPMRAMGIQDPLDGFLRLVARLSRPTRYDPNSPTFGLTEWEVAMASAIYESGWPAIKLLAERDALPHQHLPDIPDYWAELPEDAAPKGRAFLPKDVTSAAEDNGGKVAYSTLIPAAQRDGVDLRTLHRVQRLVQQGDRVVGVEATTPDGKTHRILARKAVVFATGGFTHDLDLRENFLAFPILGGCAVLTNEGDFVAISSAIGAQLRNMNYPWMCPVPLEHAIARRPEMSGMFSVAGDSMIIVNKHGRRVVNEKMKYNEIAKTFFQWDAAAAEFPNLVLVQIWDQRSQENSSGGYGSLIVPPGVDDSHVIRGKTMEDLTRAIQERLGRYSAHTGALSLAKDFLSNLRQTIERFNGMAQRGVDEDFHRGETPIQLVFNGRVKDEPGRKNPTMWPISQSGPYYAALVTGGTLDTKGGPRTNPGGQVLNDLGEPIPGLYAVGNCTASVSAMGYWAGGATIGPIMALAYRAANRANKEAPGRS